MCLWPRFVLGSQRWCHVSWYCLKRRQRERCFPPSQFLTRHTKVVLSIVCTTLVAMRRKAACAEWAVLYTLYSTRKFFFSMFLRRC